MPPATQGLDAWGETRRGAHYLQRADVR